MKTINDIISDYRSRLGGLYDSEVDQIIFLVFDHLINFRRIDMVLRKDEIVAEDKLVWFEETLKNLETGRPVQYVLGRAWFHELNLIVDGNVLIPRRETEELVDWIISDVRIDGTLAPKIFDICTGSGCIALALKDEFPASDITAGDISEGALGVAKLNAAEYSLEINFIQMDVSKSFPENYSPDIVVSNPPYVMEKEKETIHSRVGDFEPPIALFVPDDDPLFFYRHIAQWAIKSLPLDGMIYFEINEALSNDVINLLEEIGFREIILRKDLQDKDRMIRARKAKFMIQYPT